MGAPAKKTTLTRKKGTPNARPKLVVKGTVNSDSKRKSKTAAATTTGKNDGALKLQNLLHEQFESPPEDKPSP